MIVTLEGIGTLNKGAELMMYAMLQEIEKKDPGSIVYLPIDSAKQGLNYISTTLDVRLKPVQKIRDWCKRNHIIGICKRLHIPISTIFEDKYYVNGTDYLIDGSGFHYSDVWNHSQKRMENRRHLLESHKRHGAKIVLMPQAFGPLNKKSMKDGIREVDKYADIVFCRDDVSWAYLEECGQINMSKVKRFCDYTSLVTPVIPPEYKHLYGGVCIIPNCRLFDKSDLTFDEYLGFVKKIISLAQAYGKVPYLLNHEGDADTKIATQIIQNLDSPIELVDNLNALEVKGMISTAYCVISSRFHGVASALNTCVPCIATGWSHKYQELFKDYGVENGMIEINDSPENQQVLLQNILDEEKNKKQRASLEASVSKIQNKVREMWKIIWSLK